LSESESPEEKKKKKNQNSPVGTGGVVRGKAGHYPFLNGRGGGGEKKRNARGRGKERENSFFPARNPLMVIKEGKRFRREYGAGKRAYVSFWEGVEG